MLLPLSEFDYCQYINPDDNCTLFLNPDETTACSKDSKYFYDYFEYNSTIVTDLDLVCEEEFKVTVLIQAVLNTKATYVFNCFRWLS